MIKIVIVFFCSVLMLVSAPARADWGQGGAAFRCDESTNQFAIYATMDSSADENIVAPSDFVQLHSGSNSVSCRMSDTNISATVLIGEPQPRGMCGGIGQAVIRDFTIGGQAVLLFEQLGSPCRGLRGVVTIEVKKVGKSAEVSICRGAWDWTPKFIDIKCETSTYVNARPSH